MRLLKSQTARLGVRFAACTALTFGAVSSPLHALPTTPLHDTAQANEDAVLIYLGGIDSWLVSPKDRGLRNALHMMGDRVLELPAELGEHDMPAPLIKMGMDALMGEMSFQFGFLADADPAMGPPIYAQLTFLSDDPAQAAEQAGVVKQLLQQSGMPMPMTPAADKPGMMTVDLDGVPGYLGTAKFNNKHGFVVGLNEISTAPASIDASGLPRGVTPTFAMSIDTEQIMPFVQMALEQAPPMEAQMVRTNLEMMGLMSENPLSVSIAAGHGTDRSFANVLVKNFMANPMNAGAIVREPLSAGHLAMIPADATVANLKQVNYAGLPDMIRGIMAEVMANMPMPPDAPDMDNDPFEMLTAMTGIDVENGIFKNLGTVTGSYMSDTTGGSGFTSLVGFVEVTNEDGLLDTLNQISGMANQMAAGPARGYVRIGRRDVAGHNFMTLQFPGLPIPLELSMSVTDGFLWYGMTPQAVVGAINYARTDQPGLASNPRFRDAASSISMNGALSISFTDTPRLAAQGYGMTNMMMAGLANAVRSPIDAERDPGLIMPSYNELIDGAKAGLIVSRIDGDDLYLNTTGDRSVLVNIAAGVGMIGSSPALLAIPAVLAGTAMPALSKARAQATTTQGMSHLRQVAMAVHIHAADTNDQGPSSMKDLVSNGYVSPQIIQSVFGPAGDEHGDIWLDTSVKTLGSIKYPDRRILAYDRTSYLLADSVLVAFYDGHVEAMDHWAFEELVADPIHQGVNFHVPGW